MLMCSIFTLIIVSMYLYTNQKFELATDRTQERFEIYLKMTIKRTMA
jgi:hypothetical protein